MTKGSPADWVDMNQVYARLGKITAHYSRVAIGHGTHDKTLRLAILILHDLAWHPNSTTREVARRCKQFRRSGARVYNILKSMAVNGMLLEGKAGGFTEAEGGFTDTELNDTWVLAPEILKPGYPGELVQLEYRNISVERRLGRERRGGIRNKRQLRWAQKKRTNNTVLAWKDSLK